MNQAMKVFLACAVGAGTGTLVALQLNHFFWWLGLLAGGFTGYLSYEFSTIIKAVPRAWKRATSWRISKETFQEYFQSLLVLIPFSLLFTMYFGSLAIIALLDGNSINFAKPNFGVYLGFLICGIVLPLVLVFDKDLKSLNPKKFWLLFFNWNPITVVIWQTPRLVFWFLPRGIIWVAVRAPKAIRDTAVVFGCFLWHLFRLIHSEKRLLCGIDAAIGTVVGYAVGNALVGALAGGVFGVLNYEIVSKRIFHLVPIRTK